jgi:acetyl-CoA synthetase
MLKEKRVFKPSAKFAKAARIGSLKKYHKLYKASLKNPDKFWGKGGGGTDLVPPLEKSLRLETALRGVVRRRKINASVNCLDRHLEGPCATRRRSSSRENRATWSR